MKMLTGCIQRSKERISKKACEKYQNLSKEEKDKRSQYAHEQYRNLSEEEKEKSVNMVVNNMKIL